jgi:hypothetical protein
VFSRVTFPFLKGWLLIFFSGDEVLKHAANPLHPWARGFLKLDVFIRFTICGNTRK